MKTCLKIGIRVWLLLIVAHALQAQTVDTTSIYIDGSSITVLGTSKVYINGSLNNRQGDINNLGDIYLSCHLNHRYSAPLFKSESYGRVILYSDYIQNFYGDSVVFNRLIINKSNNYVVFNQSIRIYDSLRIVKGNIELNSNFINLGTLGKLDGETETNRIVSNYGYITAQKRIISPTKKGNIAGMGLTINPSSDNFGLTSITRYFRSQAKMANPGIKRYFDMQSSNPGNADLGISYFDADLDGLYATSKKVNFQLWKSSHTGLEQSYRFRRLSGVSNSMQNSVNASSVDIESSGVRFTTADTTCKNPPKVNFSSEPILLCEDKSITLDAENPACRILWFHSGDTTHTVTINAASFASGVTADTFYVRVTDTLDCATYAGQAITLKPLPIPLFHTSASYCVGEQSVYTNQSTVSSNEAMAYSWIFSNGTSSVETNPTVIYDTPGSKLAYLTVTTASGCQKTYSKSLTINPIPAADFLPSSFGLCTSSMFTLTNTSTISSGAIARSEWDFGDGYYEKLTGAANEQKKYTTAGTYIVSLKVTSSGNCAASIQKTLTTFEVPVAGFSANGFLYGAPTTFVNSSTVDNTVSLDYSWNFGDGSSLESAKEPSHIFSAPGNYSVTLSVQTPHGCTAAATKDLLITAMPGASYSFNAAKYCVGADVNFLNGSSIAGTDTLLYVWDFGDGTTSTAKNPKKQYARSGLFTVKLTTRTLSGVSASYSNNITIHPVPVATFSAANVCNGTAVSFQNYSEIADGAMNYSWSLGNGNTSTSQAPTELYASPGTYTVNLKVTSDFACADSTSHTVKVNPVPIASFAANSTCQGDVVAFTNSSSISSGSVSYLWTLGDGATSIKSNVSKTYTSYGTYTITLKVVSDQNCSATTSKKISQWERPVAGFKASGVCLGDSVLFTNRSKISSGTLTHEWDFGEGGSSTASSPRYAFGIANSYYVTLISTSDKGCKDTVADFVDVYPVPVPAFTVSSACNKQAVEITNNSAIDASLADAILTYQWDLGDGSTETSTNVLHTYPSAGDYNINLMVTSPYGCYASTSKTITNNSLPDMNFTAADTCAGLSVRFTNLSSGKLDYEWSFGDGTSSTDSLPSKTFTSSGTYYISIKGTSVYGCTQSVSKPIRIFANPVALFTATSDICSGGKATIVNSSYSPAGTLTYKWDFGDGTSAALKTVSPHSYTLAGAYTVKLDLLNSYGCKASVQKTVNVHETPVAAFTSDGNSVNQAITFLNETAISATETVSYSWNFGDGGTSVDDGTVLHTYLYSGLYSVDLDATTSFGCVSSVSHTVSTLNVPEAAFTLAGNLCSGFDVHFTNTSITNTSEKMTWLWTFGDGSTDTVKNPVKKFASAGVYTIELLVSYANGKSSSASQSVVIDALPIVDFSASHLCENGAVVFSNLSSGFTKGVFNWSFGDGSTSTDSVPTKTYSFKGNYTVELVVTSQKGCANIVSKNLMVSANPTIGFTDSIFTCGSSFTLDALNAGASYHWYPGNETTQTLIVNADGKHWLTVTDAKGCEVSDTTYVTLNQHLKVDLGIDRTVCSGTRLDAGNPGSTYVWNDGSNQRYLAVLSTGTYSVTASDANGCNGTASVHITTLETPVVNLGADITRCSGKSFELNASNDGMIYNWSTGETSQIISITKSGIYTLSVTNGNQCKGIDTIKIDILPSPTVSLGADIEACPASLPVNLNASNEGATFIWSSSETTQNISVTKSDTYIVVVTAANGCLGTDTVQVTVFSSPVLPAWSDTVHSCIGSSVMLDAGSGYSYKWSNGSVVQSQTITTSGQYYVEITNGYGCKANAVTHVLFHDLPVLGLPDVTNVCRPDLPVSISLPDGYATYSWNDGSAIQKLTTSNAGKVVGTVSNRFGCSAKDSSEIVINELPITTLPDSTFVCMPANTTLDAGVANCQYIWSTGADSRTISVSSGGLYKLKATTTSGCWTTDSVFVKEYLAPAINLGADRSICNGSTAILRAGTDSSNVYKWNDNTFGILKTVSTAGIYAVEVTDKHTCKSSSSVRITVNPSPIDAMPSSVTACNKTTVDANNGSSCSYLWSNNSTSQVIPVTASGKYIVTIKNSYGCTLRDTVNVVINPLPKVKLGSDTAICQKTLFVLDAANEGSYFIWSDNSIAQTLSVTKTGNYWVKVSDSKGCSNADTIAVTVNPLPVFDLDTAKHICYGQSYTINPQISGVEYLWSDKSVSQTITVNQTGNYRLKTTNSFNCTYADSINIVVHALPVVNLGNDTIVCGQLSLDAGNAGQTYLWSCDSTSQIIHIASTNQYWARVTDQYSCSGSDTINVTAKPAPTLKIDGKTVLCQGDTAVLTLSVDVPTYRWWNGNTDTLTKVTLSGKVFAIAWNESGCIVSDTVNVSFNPLPVVSLGSYKVSCGTKKIEVDAGNEGSAYEWISNVGFKSTERIIKVNKDGHYYVKVTNPYGCVAFDSVYVNNSNDLVYSRSLFPSEVMTGDSVVMVNLSYPQPFKSTWELGDGIIDTTYNPMHVYFLDGTFSVKLTVSNGICSDATSKNITVTLSKSKLLPSSDSATDKQQSIFVNATAYPNPSLGVFTTEIELQHEADLFIDLVGYNGIRLKLEKFNGQQFIHKSYDLSSVPPGIYFIRIIVNSEMKIIKLIKL